MESTHNSGARGEDWFVQQRVLSSDGTHLLTLASSRGTGEVRKGVLRLWEIEHRGVLGASKPRQVARVACPPGGQWYPLAATPDLGAVAVGHLGRSMHILSLGGREHWRVESGPIPSETRAALAPDATRLGLARGKHLDVWDVRSGALLATWEFAAEVTAVEFARGPTAPVLAVGLANGLVDIWS
jgi:hypothetical protein